MAGIALLVGLGMGFDQFMTLPKKKELASLEKELQVVNEKFSAAGVSMANLNLVRKRVEGKRKELERASGKISDDRQLELVLNQTGKETQTRKMDLLQLKINEAAAANPAKEKNKEDSIKKIVLEVGLSAEFQAIGPYLEGLQNLPVFMEIEKLDILRKQEGFPKLEVNLQQNIYISPKISGKGQNQKHGRETEPRS